MAVYAPRWPIQRPLAGLLSLLALAALMASTLFALADPSLLGWRPDHGHLFAGGQLPPHHHPWDQTPVADGAASSDAPGNTVVFTPGDSGAAGSITSALTSPDASIVLSATTPDAPLEAGDLPAPTGVPPRVPSPPPRG